MELAKQLAPSCVPQLHLAEACQIATAVHKAKERIPAPAVEALVMLALTKQLEKVNSTGVGLGDLLRSLIPWESPASPKFDPQDVSTWVISAIEEVPDLDIIEIFESHASWRNVFAASEC